MDETIPQMASSSLAITEKKPQIHRHGGCAGIFFQLFDWNRKFAKKKLFSRKLLPPVRATQISKKFVQDEKMPKTKLHLLAAENCEGCSVMKRNRCCSSVALEPKNDMRAPSLVARLMGLESVPDVRKDKPKKPSFAGSCDVRNDRFVKEPTDSRREDLKACGKVDSRPQKIQRTEQFERRVLTRFGAEAFQIKGVLSRSRRNYQNNIASALKSPRVSNARNVSRTSRLIDAAARILEPGLQATTRAKSALTYSSSSLQASKDEVLLEAGLEVMSPDPSRLLYCRGSICQSFEEQSSCRNCGHMLDVVDSRPNAEQQPFLYSSSASDCVNVLSQGLGKSKPISLSDLERGSNEVRLGFVDSPDRKPCFQEGQVQWKLTSHQCKPQPSFTSKQKHQAQNKMLLCKDRMPTRAKLSNLPSRSGSSSANAVCGSKGFVAVNRYLRGQTRPIVPSKVDNSSLDAERKSCNQQVDVLSQSRTLVRKRRVIEPVQSTGPIISRLGRQRNFRGGVVTGQAKGLNTCSVDRTSTKNKAACEKNTIRSNGSKEDDIVYSAFNSLSRHKTENVTDLSYQNDSTRKRASYRRKLLDENDGALFLKKQSPLTGDALGSLLEEKLKELQEEDEMVIAGLPPKKSTAVILQELISALTAEQLTPVGHEFDAEIPFQTKENLKVTSVGYARDGELLSPGSVLEASFSNGSCISSSFDNSSGCRLQLDSVPHSHDQPQLAAPDADLLDSATSLSKGSADYQMVIDLTNQISTLLHSIEYVDLGLIRGKLSYVKDVVLNAELLFGNTSRLKSAGMEDFLVTPFLLDELEVLASAMQPKFNCLLGFEETKDANQLRGFLFDCWIESFDAKYGRYKNSGFKAWIRLPLRMKAEMLVREVGEAAIRWTHLAGMPLDEIIDCEMSISLGKWIDFDIEAFETGAQVGMDILQVLVEEIVGDIWHCRPVSY